MGEYLLKCIVGTGDDVFSERRGNENLIKAVLHIDVLKSQEFFA